MLKSLLQFSLTRRPIILLCLLVFIIGGIAAFLKLNIEAYPNPAPVILEITAQANGLSAEEMERYYTIPIEVGLATTPGVDIIRSTSFYGLSFVRVKFKYGIDYYFAYQMAALNLQQNVSLPNNVQPQIQASSLVGEVLRYQLVGPKDFGITNLRTIQDWILQRRLLGVPGVVQVNTWGGTTKQYDVEINLHKLSSHNVSLQQVMSAIDNSNVNVGGRTINIGQQSVNIRGVGIIDSGNNSDVTQNQNLDDIKNIVVAQVNGIPVQIKDIANVRIGNVPRQGMAGRDNEDEVVSAVVVMNQTMHTNDVIPGIKKEIEKINSDGSLPSGVKVVPYYDRSTLVGVTTHTVMHNLIFGCLLVFLIQWVFLGDLRSAIIVGANIPFALFFSIIILVLRGEDANLLSVGALDFGIIVDSAVILVENLYRNLQTHTHDESHQLEKITQNKTDPGRELELEGMHAPIWTERLRTIYLSALQVDRAVLFSTAIIVAAFVPLFGMQGVEAKIFSPMAKTYAYALTGALIATFTITPVLASLLLPKHVEEAETLVIRFLRRIYTPVLNWALSKKKQVVIGGIVFLLLSGVMMMRLGTEFLPTLEEGNLWIRATMPTTISLEAAMPSVDKMRKILLKYPEVITVSSQHGRPDNGSEANGFFNAEFFVPLKPREEWPKGVTKDQLIDDMQKEFAKEFVGIDFNFSQYIQDNIEEGLSGIKGANSIKIIGPDLTVLEEIGGKIMSQMSNIRGVADLGFFRVLGQPNLDIKIDRNKAARYGLNTGDINAIIQTALGGTEAGTILEGARRFPLTVRAAPEYRSSISAIRNIKISYQNSAGKNSYIPLSEVANISLDTGASYIFHEKGQRFTAIKFSVRDRDLGSTVEEAQKTISKNIVLPQGYHIEWAGEFDEMQSAKDRLKIMVPLSLALIMVLLYALFNSLRDSFLVLAGIPFSIAGGVLALYLTGLNFSISAAIGFISLFGVSVMNGILIITHYNKLRLEGMTNDQAMTNAAEQQMRPMLMMALSACIGLLPAAISHGIGSEVQRPLATVVVGGMLIGPIMLLVVVPALQLLFLEKEKFPEEEKSEIKS